MLTGFNHQRNTTQVRIRKLQKDSLAAFQAKLFFLLGGAAV